MLINVNIQLKFHQPILIELGQEIGNLLYHENKITNKDKIINAKMSSKVNQCGQQHSY